MDYEKKERGYLFSNARENLQPDVIHRFLSNESYWAQGVTPEYITGCIAGSDCFAVYFAGQQVGYARMITDGMAFGYLADVFILPAHRGKGLSKTLMDFILSYPPYRKLKRIMLATRDAQGLYSQFGFTPLAEPQRFMELRPSEHFPG